MRRKNTIDLKLIASWAMLKYGFDPHCPPAVLDETGAMEASLAPSDSGVEDLRDLLWSSIDNDTSRDLDQVEYSEAKDGGDIRVLVAIADVDHYVRRSSATDRFAGHNATSVYTGVATFPMLPERLSTDLSSLNPQEDRMAVVMDFVVDGTGNVKDDRVYRAIVRNHAKLVYEIVGEWLDGRGPVPPEIAAVPGLEEQVRRQDEATRRLRAMRRKQGALEFETVEPIPVMRDGRVVDLVVRGKNRARYLIENLMIAANQTMVRFLETKGLPMIQRVVRTPERWDRIRELAASRGTELPEMPDAGTLSDFLEEQHDSDPERFPDLSLSIVKLLGPGEYSFVIAGKPSPGHFGLAVQDYTHSTAPNRRYVDLITQRLLKSVVSRGNSPYTEEDLVRISMQCSDRDKAAKKVERFMRKVAAAFLLRHRIGQVFEGIVTGASPKGVYVRLFRPPAEGRVVRGAERMDVGEKVMVRLVELDAEQGHIDFENAELPPSESISRDKKGHRIRPGNGSRHRRRDR